MDLAGFQLVSVLSTVSHESPIECMFAEGGPVESILVTSLCPACVLCRKTLLLLTLCQLYTTVEIEVTSVHPDMMAKTLQTVFDVKEL